MQNNLLSGHMDDTAFESRGKAQKQWVLQAWGDLQDGGCDGLQNMHTLFKKWAPWQLSTQAMNRLSVWP